MATDRRWKLLEVSRPVLLDRLAHKGVVRVEFVGAFPELDAIGVWLGTTSDRDRDVLRASMPDEIVRDALLDVGFRPSELRDLAAVEESQETVDRDYGGSWYYAMR